MLWIIIPVGIVTVVTVPARSMAPAVPIVARIVAVMVPIVLNIHTAAVRFPTGLGTAVVVLVSRLVRARRLVRVVRPHLPVPDVTIAVATRAVFRKRAVVRARVTAVGRRRVHIASIVTRPVRLADPSLVTRVGTTLPATRAV